MESRGASVMTRRKEKERSMMDWIRGEWWYHVRRHWTADAINWRIAYFIPRNIALLCFVRVYSVTGEAPSREYVEIYKAWEKGAGR